MQTPPPSEMATAVDGTHPTGMHSCYFNCFITASFITVNSVFSWFMKNNQHECILVGCVPPASVAVSPAQMHPPPPRHACPLPCTPLPCMPPTTHTHPAMHAPFTTYAPPHHTCSPPPRNLNANAMSTDITFKLSRNNCKAIFTFGDAKYHRKKCCYCDNYLSIAFYVKV